MTPDDLHRLLRPHGVDPEEPDALARVEALTEARPADPSLRRTLLALHAHATAGAGLRPVVAGVRREALVRWDARSTTWAGVAVDDGGPAMVRALRPEAARDPLLRRQLAREGRALAAVLPVHLHDDALTVALPGPIFRATAHGGAAGEAALARLIARTLSGLQTWDRAFLGLPAPCGPELRDAGDTLVITTLTPPEAGGGGAVVARLANALRRWWTGAADHPLAGLLDALVAAPPARVDDAAARCTATFAELLADRRHGLMKNRRTVDRLRRAERLEEALAGLDAAMPPPAGLAVLGVDLEGRPLVARSDGESVWWGSAGNEEPVFDPDDGFDVPAARRLVRVRGSAPVSERLNREAGGDPAFAEAVARWVSAALELRTLRKLLEAALA